VVGVKGVEFDIKIASAGVIKLSTLQLTVDVRLVLTLLSTSHVKSIGVKVADGLVDE
jgi:hypothetical protein